MPANNGLAVYSQDQRREFLLPGAWVSGSPWACGSLHALQSAMSADFERTVSAACKPELMFHRFVLTRFCCVLLSGLTHEERAVRAAYLIIAFHEHVNAFAGSWARAVADCGMLDGAQGRTRPLGLCTL